MTQSCNSFGGWSGGDQAGVSWCRGRRRTAVSRMREKCSDQPRCSCLAQSQYGCWTLVVLEPGKCRQVKRLRCPTRESCESSRHCIRSDGQTPRSRWCYPLHSLLCTEDWMAFLGFDKSHCNVTPICLFALAPAKSGEGMHLSSSHTCLVPLWWPRTRSCFPPECSVPGISGPLQSSAGVCWQTFSASSTCSRCS